MHSYCNTCTNFCPSRTQMCYDSCKLQISLDPKCRSCIVISSGVIFQLFVPLFAPGVSTQKYLEDVSVKPLLRSPLLSRHPLFSGHLSNPRNSLPILTVNLTSLKRSPRLSRRGHRLDFPVGQFYCISPLLNGHQVGL